MKLSLKVLKVVVALNSPFRLSVHPPLSAASVHLAWKRNLAELKYQGRALSRTIVFSQAQRMTGTKLKSTNSR